ncbi:MAG: hypothetical protein H7843_10930 [Nitrospirota bacterium]
MAQTNIYLLLAETDPPYHWISHNHFDPEDTLLRHYYQVLDSFIKQINNKIKEEVDTKLRDTLKGRCFIGYYDKDNMEKFFKRYDTHKKINSNNPLTFLRKLIRNTFENWRDAKQQLSDNEYKTFNNTVTVKDHTFCEMSQRQVNVREINYALLNHYACDINTDIISVTIEGGDTAKFFNLRCSGSFERWLTDSIIQKRMFHPNPKHVKKGQSNRSDVSELECSPEEAQDLLNTAIGGDGHKLFNYDKKRNKFIIFMDETHGECEKVYHGYHVALNSTDVPQPVKNILNRK